MDEYLVARLGSNASQVLLALILARTFETNFSQAEFATRTGLSRRSVASGLHELERLGLINIVPQHGRPALVKLRLEYEAQRNIQEVAPLQITSQVVPPVLAVEVPEEPGEQTTETDPLVLCRLADENSDRKKQISALQAVWDQAFPVSDYPFQRLTPDTAKSFLVNRSSEFVGASILEVVSRSKEKINAPRAFIRVALENADKKRAQAADPEVSINDDLRKLAEYGRQQYGKRN